MVNDWFIRSTQNGKWLDHNGWNYINICIYIFLLIGSYVFFSAYNCWYTAENHQDSWLKKIFLESLMLIVRIHGFIKVTIQNISIFGDGPWIPAHVIWWLGPCAREQIDMSSSRMLLCFFICVECSTLFFLHWCPFPARNGTVAKKKILECMCKCHLSANHFSPHVGWLRRCLHGYFCWS